MINHLLKNDLDFIFNNTLALWEDLRNQRIFISGGTGFFGCWMLESFVWANERLKLNASAHILTRNLLNFSKKCPHLVKNTSLQFIEGDVRNFEFPRESFSHIIHAATDTSVTWNDSDPLLMLDTIIQGTKHILEFARYCKTKRFLLISSGAVYGKQPDNITHLSEEYPCQPDSESAYAMGKLTAEHFGYIYTKKFAFDVKIARCFAFVGPYLPLDAHFAIGNFIRDGLNGEPILIKSDGTSYRSYLYAADLAIWLWTILMRGQSAQPYNVGSDRSYTIAEIAKIVAKSFEPEIEVKILKSSLNNKSPERYVPDIKMVKKTLGLREKIHLNQAIQLTKMWHLQYMAQEYAN